MPYFMFTFAILASIGVSQAQTLTGGSSSSLSRDDFQIGGISSSSIAGAVRSSGTRRAASSSSSSSDGLKSSTTLSATSEDNDQIGKVDLLEIALDLMKGNEDPSPLIDNKIVAAAPEISIPSNETPRDQSVAPPPTQAPATVKEELVQALVEAGESVGLVSPEPQAPPEKKKPAQRPKKREDKTTPGPLDLRLSGTAPDLWFRNFSSHR
ncbi:hypothetical protein BSKO_11367 [Bryopsis sp. KO-2023]|nr:hypothetical protein BSKO_11367 [Bryopsis sp. KO-2023]